ncbi:MAG: hypothetical protein H6Q43_1049 [Deltaproteobacteria bacterium]|nr:hypothetical protein [Deltaproteobacteria bacterium]MBP1717611.1 hypothetical protein [Deltaproteobacteria bacterium]
MAIWIFAVAFVFFCSSDSFAQVYKYKDKDGNIVFTDNPSSMVKEAGGPKEEKPKEEILPKKRSARPVKDVNQLGEEMLEQELAKPPAKQDKRLIQELREILYGDASGKKPQTIKEPESKESAISAKNPPQTTKKQ